MREFFESCWLFVWGILKRFYIWIYAFILDPLDLYNRYINPKKEPFNMPSEYFPLVLGVLVFIAGFITFHKLRVKNLEKNNYQLGILPGGLSKVCFDDFIIWTLETFALINKSTHESLEIYSLQLEIERGKQKKKLEPLHEKDRQMLQKKANMAFPHQGFSSMSKNLQPNRRISLNAIFWEKEVSDFEITNASLLIKDSTHKDQKISYGAL